MNFFPPNVICCFIKTFFATKPSRLYLSLINRSCETRSRDDKINTTWILDHFDSQCHFTGGWRRGENQRTLWSHKYSATARRVTYKSRGVRVWFYHLICHHQTTNIYCFMKKKSRVDLPCLRLAGRRPCFDWLRVMCLVNGRGTQDWMSSRCLVPIRPLLGW